MNNWTNRIIALLIFLILLVHKAIALPFYQCSIDLAASICSTDDTVFGTNSITLDRNTNIEWLDVTLSVARSYNDILSNFGVGGDFEGFRYATRFEVIEFWKNAGIVDIGGPTSGQSEANLIPVNELLVNYIGVIETPLPSRNSSIAFISTMGDASSPANISTLFADFDRGVGEADDIGGSQSKSLAAARFGSFLVRGKIIPVPEPSTLSLAALFFGLLLINRRLQ